MSIPATSLPLVATLLPVVVLGALLTTAAIVDISTHRIPNRLAYGGAVVGCILQTALHGWSGMGTALGGAITGLAVMLPLYAIGVMGAGDAKLLAMVGAYLDPIGIVTTALLTFLAGGILALAYAALHGSVVRLFSNVKTMLWLWLARIVTRTDPVIDEPLAPVGRLAYAIAIAVGTLAYLVMSYGGVTL